MLNASIGSRATPTSVGVNNRKAHEHVFNCLVNKLSALVSVPSHRGPFALNGIELNEHSH